MRGSTSSLKLAYVLIFGSYISRLITLWGSVKIIFINNKKTFELNGRKRKMCERGHVTIFLKSGSLNVTIYNKYDCLTKRMLNMVNIIIDPIYWLYSNGRITREYLNFSSDNFAHMKENWKGWCIDVSLPMHITINVSALGMVPNANIFGT